MCALSSPTHAIRRAIAEYKPYQAGPSGPHISDTMREFAKSFYKSRAWKDCRAAYLNRKHGLCEECMKHGLYTPADTVHHIIHLTPENINDPSITLNPDNLRAVCRDCHAALHSTPKRFKIDGFGHVITLA